MRNRILPLGLAFLSVIIIAVLYSQKFGPSDAVQDKLERQKAYEKMLAEHPYNMSAEEVEAIPKAENPSERYFQDYLLTMDPATQTVPVQRLVEANEQVTAQKKSNFGILASSMSWSERGPDDVGGRTRTIMFDPNDVTNSKVWAGGVGGGLWYTNDITNASTVWNSVDDFWANLAVTAMAYDPTDTDVFYVGTGEGFFNADAILGAGVWKSTDGGSTWAQLVSTSPATTTTFSAVQDLVVTGAGTVLVATREGGGVQRSTNGGTSFSIVLNGTHTGTTSRAADLEIDANGDIWASMGVFSTSGVWKSVDDGLTWTQMNTGTNGFPTAGFGRIEIATAPSDANVVYALTHDAFTNGIQAIYRSGDGGVNWVSMPLPADCDVATMTAGDFTRGQAWYDLIAVVNPNDPNDVIVGGIDLFRTTDANADSGGGAGTGATWNQISIWFNPASLGCTLSPAPPVVHADHHQIVYRPGSSTEVVFGHDGGIDYTADVTVAGMPTYVNRNNGYNVTQYYAVDMQSLSGNNLLVGGTQDNGTPQINSAGIGTSFGDGTGGDGAFTHINQATNIVAVGANTGSNTHRSLNGGLSFTYVGTVAGCTASFINPSDLDDGTSELFLNCGTSVIGHAYNLSVGGFTTRTIGPGGGLGATATHIRTSPFGSPSSATVYVGTASGAIHRVADAQNGGTPVWSVIDTTPLPVGSISSIDFGAGEDTLLVTFSNYGVASVWETFDGGATWNDRDTGSNLPDAPVRWGMYNPNNRSKVMLATEAGVMETDDIGAGPAVWAAPAGFPTVRVDMLRYRAADDVILAATHGRGLWTGTVSTLPVELVSFNPIVDGNDVTLLWNTASETSNAGFDIEHAAPSANRSSAELNFKSIAFVDGQGTTTEGQDYSYSLNDLDPGTHTFRLKQVDLDGSFSYSEIVEVDIAIPGAALLSQAYPNPFQDEARITLSVASTQNVDVHLYDMQGRRVATLYSGPVDANQPHEILVKADGLASGQYIYRATGDAFMESKTISLVK